MKAHPVLLIILLLAIASCQQWDDRPNQQLQPIRLSKQIKDVIIEEYETSVINLIDYVSGSLINYQYNVSLVNGSSHEHNVTDIMRVANKSIKILPQVEYFSFQYLPNSDLSGAYETFTRSTLMLDNGQGVLKMYLIDRSFNFVSYSFENYLQNTISNRNWKRLDMSTIQGGACSDLKHVQMNDTNQFLIAFCLKSEKVEAEEQQARKTYMTIIQIRKFAGPDPLILYYTQDYDRFPIDFTSPVRFVANFTNVTTEENNQTTQGFYGLFLLQMQDEPEYLKNFPRFCWMNFSIFEEMYQQGNYIKFASENDQNLMIRASSLYLKNHVNDVRLIDFKTIFKQQTYTGYLTNSTTLNLAIVMEAYGMMLCQVDDYKETIYRNQTVWCNETENAFIQQDSSALSIFYEPTNPDQRLYMISASPPRVFEYEISDFRNNVLVKIYVAQAGISRRFVALPQMAANMNQILLLMRDIYTGQNVIRIYSRNTTFFRSVQNDIYLPELSRSGYFFFPNYYFNKFIFRDEMTVNITLSNSNKLVFDRSEQMLQKIQDSYLLNGHTFNITLYHRNLPYQDGGNELVYITDIFVTFVDKYNLDIFQTSEERIQQAGGLLNLYYSCGDTNFTYNVDQLYNGPEYSIKINHQNDSHVNYFEFSQAREELQQLNSFNSSNCTQSYLVPDSRSRSKKMLLVCLSFNPAHLTSYSFNSSLEYINLSPSGIQNDIYMPLQKIVMNNYDFRNNILIVIVAFVDNIKDVQEGCRLEVHFIETTDTMNWRAKHGLNCSEFTQRPDDSNDSLIDIFTYSSFFYKGLIIQNNNVTLANGSEMNNASIIVFQVDYINYVFSDETFYGNLTVNGNIVRAQITTQNLFLCLTDKGKLYIMQIFPDIIKPVDVRSSLNSSRTIIDFDIYDLKYLVLYHNDSVTEVYSLIDNIETSFRMRLPLYKKYEKFVYKMFKDTTHRNKERFVPKKSSFENSLAILMQDTESDLIVYMIYMLNEPQHNSLFISNNSLSEVIKDSNHTWIMLTGDREELSVHYMGVVTDNAFSLVLIKYYDQIKVDLDNNKQLIESCKNFNEGLSLRGYYPSSFNIQQIQIYPISDLGKGSTSVVNPQGNLTLSMQSTNNGIVIVPIMRENEHIQFSDRSNDKTIDNYEARDLSLMVGNYLQGYNMNFNAKCSYTDQEGKQQDCTKSLKLSTLTQSYNFPISFATSKTKVLFGFPIERLIMMIDNTGFLRIQKIQDNYDLTNSQQQPLDNILELQQLDVLGCLIDSDSQFAKVQWLNHTSIQLDGMKEYKDREIFLFFYQCYDAIDRFRKLKAIEIAVFKEGFCPPQIRRDSDSCFVYTRINDGIQIQQDVIDFALGNLTYALPQNFSFKERDSLNISSHLSYTSHLAVVCGIKTSFSNLLLIYDLNITGINAETMNKTIVNMTLVKYNSASKLSFDTFKVNSVVPVLNSKFIVASIDGFGAIFYHTGINEIVYKINITEPDPMFGLYDEQTYGDIKIFVISVSYPYNIFLMTNIGTVVYGMNISMSEEAKILAKPELYRPKLVRVQRFPFQISDMKQVTTPNGLALLIKSPMGRGLYKTLLTAVTFFQPLQSKLFKTIVVDESGNPENLNCTSFMRNKKLETSVEDQLGISMLCNQKMRAARFCLRPNMNLSFFEYINNGLNSEEGILSFNNFSVILQAENDFTYGDVNNASINLTINYSMIPKQRTAVFTFVIVALLVFLSMILFLFVRSRESKYDSRQERLRQQVQFEQDEFQKRQSMFFISKLHEPSYYKTADTKESLHVDLSQGKEDNSLKQRSSKRNNSKRESRQSENVQVSQGNQTSQKGQRLTEVSFNAIPNVFHFNQRIDTLESQSKQKKKVNSGQFGKLEEDEDQNQVRLSNNIQDAELTNQTFEDESFVSFSLR